VFSGIVEEVGHVVSWKNPRLTVRARKVMEDLKVSESISVNGTCLTVVATTKETFTVDLSPETLRRTNLGVLKTGSGVNLERSLAVGGRMGGHIVQGHVDGTGRFLRSIPEGQEMWMMWFSAPERLMPYIVEKGFIAVDGISLTVVNREGTSFSIAVIPYTLNNTVLKERKPGDPVNIEVDILAKYVESLLKGERFTGSETTSS
jgi:riboflavin synthase